MVSHSSSIRLSYLQCASLACSQILRETLSSLKQQKCFTRYYTVFKNMQIMDLTFWKLKQLQKQIMKRHIAEVHAGQHQFQCEICNRKLPDGGRLRDHVKNVHTKVTCEICHEVQYNMYYLTRHKASAHGIIPSGYSKCPHCALVFKQKEALMRHITTKHR